PSRQPPHSSPTRRSSDLAVAAAIDLVGDSIAAVDRVVSGPAVDARGHRDVHRDRVVHIGGGDSNQSHSGGRAGGRASADGAAARDRKSTRLNSSHVAISY